MGLTRHKVSDRGRERAGLLTELLSCSKLRRRAARGSLHRLVRPLLHVTSLSISRNQSVAELRLWQSWPGRGPWECRDPKLRGWREATCSNVACPLEIADPRSLCESSCRVVLQRSAQR